MVPIHDTPAEGPAQAEDKEDDLPAAATPAKLAEVEVPIISEEDENPLTTSEVPTAAEESTDLKVATRTSLLLHAERPVMVPTREVSGWGQVPYHY